MRNRLDRARGLNLLAATLVPTSSFVHFVRSQGYPMLAPEVLLALLGVAGVGVAASLIIDLKPRVLGPVLIAALVTWFVDVNVRIDTASRVVVVAFTAMAAAAVLAAFVLRDHLGRIVSAVFGTILVSTLLLGGDISTRPAPEARAPDRPDLPVVVHLILDEHMGLAGIPGDAEHGRAVRRRLDAFYGGRGFRVFPRAFSQYVDSRHAIGHALNFAETFDATLVRKASGVFAWRMTRNEYLTHMRHRGYRAQVYQPDYMDLCPESPAAGEHCHTYRASSLKVIESVDLPTWAKLRITASTYLLSSRLYKRSRDHYQAFRAGRLGRRLALPDWSWERSRPHTIAAMSAFDLLKADLSRAQPGDLFLAHLLIPHYPYVYDAACALRTEPGEWLEHGLPEGSAEAPNSAGSRVVRYGLYLEQVECVTRKVDEVLAALRERGLLERAVVLVHGDHGSRIARTDPIASNRDRLAASDFTDAFSTLFAVRAPGVEGGSDAHPWSLVELMRHFATESFATIPVRQPGQPVAPVYMRKDGTDGYEPVPPEMIWSRVASDDES